MIRIFGDLHFGMKRNSEMFHTILKREFSKAVYSFQDGDSVIFLGDIFDNRNSVDFKILNFVCSAINNMLEHDMKIYIVMGNHDLYYNDDSNVNIDFLEHLSQNVRSKFVKIIRNVEKVKIEDVNFLAIPWLNTEEDISEAKKSINRMKYDAVIGHFDISGNYTSKENSTLCFESSDFSKCENVFVGHFHQKQKYENVHYVGSFISKDFSDVRDTKGYYTFGLKEGLLFYQNNAPIFDVVNADETDKFLNFIDDVNEGINPDVKGILSDKIKGNFIGLNLSEYGEKNREIIKFIKSFDPLSLTVRYIKKDKEVEKVDFEGFNENTDIINVVHKYVEAIKESLPSTINHEEVNGVYAEKFKQFSEMN